MTATDDDRATVLRLAGIMVGQLTTEEMESFERCVREGTARRDYSGASGFFGIAKVRYCGSCECHSQKCSESR